MRLCKCISAIILPMFLSYMIIDEKYPWVMAGYAIFLLIAEYGYYLTIKRYGIKQGVIRIGVVAFIIASLSAVVIICPEYVPFMDLLVK